jgi:hypothetical protein
VHRRRTKEGPGPVISTSANYRMCTLVRLHRRHKCAYDVMRGRRKCARCNLELVWWALYILRMLCPLGEWYLIDAPEDQALSAAHDGRPAYLHICNNSTLARQCIMCSLVLAAPQLLVIHKLCATDFWNAHHAHSPMCHHTRTLRTIFNLPSAVMLWVNGLTLRNSLHNMCNDIKKKLVTIPLSSFFLYDQNIFEFWKCRPRVFNSDIFLRRGTANETKLFSELNSGKMLDHPKSISVSFLHESELIFNQWFQIVMKF